MAHDFSIKTTLGLKGRLGAFAKGAISGALWMAPAIAGYECLRAGVGQVSPPLKEKLSILAPVVAAGVANYGRTCRLSPTPMYLTSYRLGLAVSSHWPQPMGRPALALPAAL